MEHRRILVETCKQESRFPRHTDKPNACRIEARRKHLPQSIAQLSCDANPQLKEIKEILMSENEELHQCGRKVTSLGKCDQSGEM